MSKEQKPHPSLYITRQLSCPTAVTVAARGLTIITMVTLTMMVLAMMAMITMTSDDFDEYDKNGSGSSFLQPFKEQSKFSKGFFRTQQSHLIA